jgi:hypothetical protein
MVVAVLMLLCVPVGCSCSPKRVDPPVVSVEVGNGWSALGATPETIAGEADRARRSGHPRVADVLDFYADSSRVANDVVLVVTAADGRAVVAIRRHEDVATPLDRVVDRQVGDAKAQGAVLTATRATFRSVPAWEVVHTGAPDGLRDVTYWFDRAGGRFTVEITGPPADVAALADAVRIR